MSKECKKVVSAAVMLAVGMTIGITGTAFTYSATAKKDLKNDIAVAQEYSNLMYSLAEVYYKQADYVEKADLSKIRKETGDIVKNGADNIRELSSIAENIDSKIFINSNDVKNIVKLEQTLDNMDIKYWKTTAETEKKELEQMKTGVQ